MEYKKQKNPLQQLYKLIMNSCYGKTIEKPVDKELVYVSGEEKIKKYISILQEIIIQLQKLFKLKILKLVRLNKLFLLISILISVY